MNEFDLNELEKSIITKYRSKLWSPFIKGVKEYSLVEENDKIAVCISGGKDSLLMAKLFQELQKYGNVKFELEFIAMNPGFDDDNTKMLKETSEKLGIDIKEFDTKIFDIAYKIAEDYPCFICAKMRRGALYDYAQKLGCNKIALGHHYNDFIETTMMNVLYAGNFKTMLPKLKSQNYENMELIRPMVYLKERDIIAYTNFHKIRVMNCGCVVAAKKTSSKRREVKELIEKLRETNKDVEKSIFSASKNVNMDAIIGYTKDKKHHMFFED